MPITADTLAIILAVFASISFASSVILIRKGTVKGNPLDGALVTVGISAMVFLLFSIFQYYPNFNLTMVSFLSFSGAGVMGSWIGRISYFSGIQKIGASRTLPVTRGSLLVSTILAILFLGEFIRVGHFIGIILLATGVIAVSYESGKDDQNSEWRFTKSLIYPFIAMVLFGFSRPLAKIGLNEGTHVAVGLAIKFLIAFLGLVGYFLWKKRSLTYPLKTEQKYYFIGSGILSTVGFSLLYSALNIARVVIVSPFYGLSPIFVLILSAIFLKKLENITKLLVIGSILVVTGTISIVAFA